MITMFLSFGFSNAQSFIYKETPSSWIRVGKCEDNYLYKETPSSWVRIGKYDSGGGAIFLLLLL